MHIDFATQYTALFLPAGRHSPLSIGRCLGATKRGQLTGASRGAQFLIRESLMKSLIYYFECTHEGTHEGRSHNLDIPHKFLTSNDHLHPTREPQHVYPS